eukprot:1815479-Rhodomonas_salina.1
MGAGVQGARGSTTPTTTPTPPSYPPSPDPLLPLPASAAALKRRSPTHRCEARAGGRRGVERGGGGRWGP